MDRAIFVTKTKDYCSAYYFSDDQRIRATAEANFTGREWWVARVLVQPDSARGKGLGGRLLEELKKAVVEMGGTSLLVTPGGYSNERRRQFKFYKAHGFKDADSCRDGLLEAQLTKHPSKVDAQGNTNNSL